MSFSDFHPELWSPNWGVSTIIIGLISFMNTEEMTTGGLRATTYYRRQCAQSSIAFNLDSKKNEQFTKIFQPELLLSIGCRFNAEAVV